MSFTVGLRCTCGGSGDHRHDDDVAGSGPREGSAAGARSAAAPPSLASECSSWTLAGYGATEALAARLERGLCAVDTADAYGYTPLHFAAQGRHLDTVRMLLSRGASPDASGCGATALHRACCVPGNAAVVAELLRAGADPNRADASTAARDTPLIKAAANGAVDVLLQLLEAGTVNADARNAAGFTARDLVAGSVPAAVAARLGEPAAPAAPLRAEAAGADSRAPTPPLRTEPRCSVGADGVGAECVACGARALFFVRRPGDGVLVCRACGSGVAYCYCT